MPNVSFQVVIVLVISSLAIGGIAGWLAASHWTAHQNVSSAAFDDEHSQAIDRSSSQASTHHYVESGGNPTSPVPFPSDEHTDNFVRVEVENFAIDDRDFNEPVDRFDGSDEAQRRAAVAQRLANEAVFNDLNRLLGEGDWESRSRLIRMVSIVGGLDCIEVKHRIGGAMTSDNASERALALYVAATLAPDSYATQIEEAAIAGDVDERIAVASGLGAGKSRDGWYVLQRLLADSDPTVERQAIQSIGKIRDTKSIPHLISRTHSADLQTAVAAAEALRSMDREREAAQLVPRIAPTLRDPDSATRLQGVRMLERMGVEESRPYLVEALNDTSASVRAAATRALKVIDSDN